ncbi:MAG: bifunctional alpha,alpha-trehalose-phosphate synthase (UDP-forming)/trehalose-phosphatase [Ignavibacteriae bacterium]|nr:bifunctional alpha,alpha-trehalose-phosphate synthase (UDP-forming)/trehalose-phosphatase [Ignavibacteriota bacterium]
MTENHHAPKRLIVVSNRLPFNVKIEDGTLQYAGSAGGVATGLASYLAGLHQRANALREYVWVGWPGATIDAAFEEQLKREAREQYNSHPVFLTDEEMDQFYFGFCNSTIWPLFHYFPSYTAYQEKQWQQYRHVNEVFCKGVLEVLRPDDLVWVHDYHLMLLPRLLKQAMPSLQVGFFLHIPFPSFEIFRLLPGSWRRDILDGLLGADLIGFHTFDYTQHFLQCVLRILGLEHNMGQILTPDRVVKVETFPMGIDYEKFSTAANSPEVKQEAQKLRQPLGDVKIILSVDRLDYTKGILNRLAAFEILLDTHAEYRGKVVLVMNVVPSRIGVYEYDKMKRQIEELVGKINGRFSSIEWTPVIYLYRNTPFETLVAHYAISDVALVTPLRDGMNLVAKEYVASRTEGTGVLILSEMAGAVKELGEAITINPNNREEISDAMKQALEIPLDEQKSRIRTMQLRLRRYNVNRWAQDFTHELMQTEQVQNKFCAKLMNFAAKEELIDAYRSRSRRILLLDYDGTLTPLVSHPAAARPTQELLQLITSLATVPGNSVVLISGRDKETLQAWFGALPVSLAAEHGTWIRESGEEWKMPKQLTSDWKAQIRAILEIYADRLPGAMIEEKDFSLAWHYRTADPEQGLMLARELTDHLVTFTANIDLQVMRGHKVIEVRGAGVNKGTAAQYLLAKDQFDFILSLGDDWTDEDMFGAMPEWAYTIRVGMAGTHARFNLRTPRDVLRLLETIAKVSAEIESPEKTLSETR